MMHVNVGGPEDGLQPRVERLLGAPVTLERIQKGAASLTFLAEIGQNRTRAVVRSAPAGVMPTLNRDVLRQALVLDRLRSCSDLPIPAVLGTDPGDPPAVPPFYVMEFAVGSADDPFWPSDALPEPELLGAQARALAALLPRLHLIPLTAAGLDAEPATTVPGEVQRWARTFSKAVDDTEPLARQARECADDLLADVPLPTPWCLTHGDYRLGNVLLDGSVPTAIVDWELWTPSDHRFDLAFFLFMSDRHRPTAYRDAEGIPPRDELVAIYETAWGRRVQDLPWFDAAVRFKSAATLALLLKLDRRKGGTRDPLRARWSDSIPVLLSDARSILADRRSGRAAP
jgi:aminoglycoside phosphotransferase (APT) family kinase protein